VKDQMLLKVGTVIYIYIYFNFFGRGCLFQCLMSWNFPRASRFS